MIVQRCLLYSCHGPALVLLDMQCMPSIMHHDHNGRRDQTASASSQLRLGSFLYVEHMIIHMHWLQGAGLPQGYRIAVCYLQHCQVAEPSSCKLHLCGIHAAHMSSSRSGCERNGCVSGWVPMIINLIATCWRVQRTNRVQRTSNPHLNAVCT